MVKKRDPAVKLSVLLPNLYIGISFMKMKVELNNLKVEMLSEIVLMQIKT